MDYRFHHQALVELKILDVIKRKDKDNSGTLEPDELAECLELMGLIATDEDIDFLTKHFDKNGKILFT